MNITNQTNHNECGVCVVKSLADHYNKENIKYTDILSQANLTNDGLSIYELEILGAKYGLDLDSYECDINELFSLKRKDYFIVIINEQEMNHFVIAKIINNDCIEIYCSINGIYQLKKQEFEKVWKGIYIKVSRLISDFKFELSKKIDWNLINWKNFVILNLFNLAMVVFSIVGSLFSQKVIELVIHNKDTKFLLSIAISFILVFSIETLFSYLSTLYSSRTNLKFYKQLHKKTLIILNHKYLEFFKKVDYGYIVNFEQYLYQFSSFYNMKLNQIISNIILMVAIIIIAGFINYVIILILLVFSLVVVILKIVKTKLNKNELVEVEASVAKYQKDLIKFTSFIQSNKYYYRSNGYLEELEAKFKKMTKQSKTLLINNNNIDLIDNLINMLFYVFNIVFCSILIVNGKLQLSQLMLVTSLTQMFIGSVKGFSDIFYELEILKIAKKIIYDIWNVNNFKLHDGIELNQVNNIKYKDLLFENDTLLMAKNGYGKTTILQAIAQMKENDDVLINDLRFKTYNSESLRDKIVYLNDEYKFDKHDIFKLLRTEYDEYIANLISKLGLSSIDDSSMSLGQVQILNYLSLINCQNKVLLLDEVLNHVDQEWKQILMQHIKPIITEKNFVITVDHDIKDNSLYFNNIVTLNEKIYQDS